MNQDLRLRGSPMQDHHFPNRILIVVNILLVGGAEQQVVSLACGLSERGWEVAIACLVGPETRAAERAEYDRFARRLAQYHVRIESLQMRRSVPDIRGIFRLRNLIRSFQPGIVHCHMFHSNLLGRITRLICPMPALICTSHSIKENSRRGGPIWHRDLLYRWTDSLADRTTTICQAAFERYLRVGAVRPDRLWMVPNCIDVAAFTPSDQRRERTRQVLGVNDEFVWLAVGRMVVQKDYPNLFRALERIADRKHVVVLAGGGPLLAPLQAECARRGLADRVRFCGNREDVRDLYDAADGYVMPSATEGLPLVLLEAAAMGLPAVVTDVGGNREVVNHNVSGYVVAPHDPVRLAEALVRMMELSPQQRRAMGRAAREHCEQHYHLNAVMDQWLDLYSEFLPALRPASHSEVHHLPASVQG